MINNLVFSFLVLLLAGFVLHGGVRRLKEEKRIQALGGHAPRYPSWTPFGLGFPVAAVSHALRRKYLEYWHYVLTTYGNPSNPYTLEITVAGERVIWTADPENIKAFLATQFADYGKGAQFNKDFHDFLGDSIFTTDGDQWHRSRQLIRPQFIKDRVSDLHVFERHSKTLVEQLGGNGTTVDVLSLFLRFTLDSATEFLLGQSVNSLRNPQVRFAQAFQEVQRVQSLIAIGGPLNAFIPKKTFREGIDVINTFVQPFIEQALRLTPEELEMKTKSDEGYTFLHALASYTRDRKVLRDQIVAVLLAGRDTTASTLSWLFYELSSHPEVVRKLRREIAEVVGLQRPPTYEDLKSMKYLQHAINETLRIYPVLPVNIRVAMRDTTLPHGGGPSGDQPIGILKDTIIGYSTLVMQRRPDIYPSTIDGNTAFPPVLEFVPERWASWTPKAWTYIPFNGGPRICVGQQFALTQIAYTTVRILQRFARVENRMNGKEPGLKADIILMPATGVQVAFWEGEKS